MNHKENLYVLDASIIIKWFKIEEYREKAIQFREDFLHGKCDIVIPELLMYEIANVLRYNKIFREKEVLDSIESLYDIELNVVIPTSFLLRKATSLAYKKDITVYDAIYVVLAKELNYYFVTADKKLYQKVKDIPFVIFIDQV
ncbi:MAG: type II toxin-antitoxin system VapC family toxin [bacterium]